MSANGKDARPLFEPPSANGWCKVPHALVDRVREVGHATAAVYLALARHADANGCCWPSLATIRKTACVHKATVCRALKTLESLGLLTVERAGQPKVNVYHLTPSRDSRTAEPITVPPCDHHRFRGATLIVAQQNHEQEPRTRTKNKNARARFTPPTLAEVTAYCRERGNHVDPQAWLDHYEANGWRVGRNAMKDWRAAVRTWERNGVSAVGSNGRAAEPKRRYL